jgi:Holliday junction resolvasome RuvABC DNA-binding subunit
MSTNEETATVNKTAIRTPRRTKDTTTPTIRQRRIAKAIVDNLASGKQTAKVELLRQNGYGTSLQNNPKRVLESAGTIKALGELGFNPETAKKVVESIMLDESAMNKDRLKASDMVFKVHGTYAPDKHVSLNIDAQVDDARLLELAQRLRNA